MEHIEALPTNRTSIYKVDHDLARAWVRTYNSAPNTITVQVRGPLRRANGAIGNFDVSASADISLAEAIALRDALTDAIRDVSPAACEADKARLNAQHRADTAASTSTCLRCGRLSYGDACSCMNRG